MRMPCSTSPRRPRWLAESGVHWPFGDWLVRDGGLRGTVIRLGHAFEAVALEEDTVTIGAAAF